MFCLSFPIFANVEEVFVSMDQELDQLSEFGKIFAFLVLGILFVMIAYGISFLIARDKPSPLKLMSYECGEEPEGNSRIQFNSRFYVIALVFLLFDVEIVFLFPWATVFAQPELIRAVPAWGWLSFGEMAVFISVLLVGLLYVWVKGDLEWLRPRPLVPQVDSKVPAGLYERINSENYVVKPFVAAGKAAPGPGEAAPTPGEGSPAPQQAKTGTPRPVFKPRILKKDS